MTVTVSRIGWVGLRLTRAVPDHASVRGGMLEDLEVLPGQAEAVYGDAQAVDDNAHLVATANYKGCTSPYTTGQVLSMICGGGRGKRGYILGDRGVVVEVSAVRC